MMALSSSSSSIHLAPTWSIGHPEDRAVAQAVSRWLPTAAAARVQNRV
jgi:hypothetical protein